MVTTQTLVALSLGLVLGIIIGLIAGYIAHAEGIFAPHALPDRRHLERCWRVHHPNLLDTMED